MKEQRSWPANVVWLNNFNKGRATARRIMASEATNDHEYLSHTQKATEFEQLVAIIEGIQTDGKER